MTKWSNSWAFQIECHGSEEVTSCLSEANQDLVCHPNSFEHQWSSVGWLSRSRFPLLKLKLVLDLNFYSHLSWMEMPAGMKSLPASSSPFLIFFFVWRMPSFSGAITKLYWRIHILKRFEQNDLLNITHPNMAQRGCWARAFQNVCKTFHQSSRFPSLLKHIFTQLILMFHSLNGEGVLGRVLVHLTSSNTTGETRSPFDILIFLIFFCSRLAADHWIICWNI